MIKPFGKSDTSVMCCFKVIVQIFSITLYIVYIFFLGSVIICSVKKIVYVYHNRGMKLSRDITVYITETVQFLSPELKFFAIVVIGIAPKTSGIQWFLWKAAKDKQTKILMKLINWVLFFAHSYIYI